MLTNIRLAKKLVRSNQPSLFSEQNDDWQGGYEGLKSFSLTWRLVREDIGRRNPAHVAIRVGGVGWGRGGVPGSAGRGVWRGRILNVVPGC